MNTKLIVGMAALLLAAPAISASDYHRESFGPTTVAVTAVITAGISFCDDNVGSINPAFLCGQGGVGAIIALDGSAANGEDDLNPATKVSGTCNVNLTTPQGGLNGDYSYSCGVDRDDDNFVTNVDATVDAGETRGYDDDSTGNVAKGTTATVCFREDIAGKGGDFDNMAVFIAINVPSNDVGVGTFDIDVSLASSGSCTPSSFEDQPPA